MNQFSAPKYERVLEAEFVERHISDAALVAVRKGKGAGGGWSSGKVEDQET
jgi:hypothetical protein